MRMSRRLEKAEKLGVVFTIIMATLGSTFYMLSGGMPAVGLFFAINNSVWEQLRLMIFPYLLWGGWEFLRYAPHPMRFITAKASALLLALAGSIVSYYTYSGILGFHLIWLNVIGYLGVICFAFWYSHRLYFSSRDIETYGECAVLALILLLIAFFGFTLAPLPIGIFRG